MGLFSLQADYAPAGGQPEAIAKLTADLRAGKPYETLLGVTGSGKTYVMANVIQQLERPVLVISHNKTLAAQLYSEFRSFFPNNAVEYFVSYYDYYQPEAYLPQTDIYIEKDASINEDLDRLRLSASSSLLMRRDVVVVASVSCIYGLGSPKEYAQKMLMLQRGEEVNRETMLRKLVDMQYERKDIDFQRGSFRVAGDSVTIWPAYLESAVQVEFFGDEVDLVCEVDPLTGEVEKELETLAIYPAKHFVVADGTVEVAVTRIEKELEQRLYELERQKKLLEAQRLEARTRYDIELLREVGYCKGIENYSRHFDGREVGERPYCLLDYFPDDYLLIIDESHVTIPQVRAMYNGDRSRKEVLVDHGFRLPSALDNRPLTFDEFQKLASQTVYVSATPADYELELSGGEPVELVVRPTGLVDPPIEIRPAKGQVKDILSEIEVRAERKERVLVTTLTKRLAEDLDSFLRERGLRSMYLHSDIKAIDRIEILKNLRIGAFDALIGVNLLREGLDLPEVTLVCILDADKEGFLRSRTSLVQIIGRTARNVEGRVILYADRMTTAMNETIEENNRRREAQLAYNEEHGITPETVVSRIASYFDDLFGTAKDKAGREPPILLESAEKLDKADEISLLQVEMAKAAEEMRYEDAAAIRDRLLELDAPISYNKDETAPLPPRKRRRGSTGGPR